MNRSSVRMITGNLTQPLTIVWNKNSSGRNFLKPWKAIKWRKPFVTWYFARTRLVKNMEEESTFGHNLELSNIIDYCVACSGFVNLTGRLIGKRKGNLPVHGGGGLMCPILKSKKCLSSREDGGEVDIWWAIGVIWWFLTAPPPPNSVSAWHHR